MHITHALESLCPGAEWIQEGDTYEGLIWKDLTIPKPSQQEIEEELERLSLERTRTLYQRKRTPEYPSIGDQLDALWKGGDAAAEMLAKVQAVKNKYPKPE
jgi:hypothetical protein